MKLGIIGAMDVEVATLKENMQSVTTHFRTGMTFFEGTLGGVDAVAAPILSSVCVVSLLLSRIFLKEKLSWKTYAFIGIVIVGILLLAVAEEL